MKYLSIFRHAKAERPEGYADDRARPLTTRGVKDASAMGSLLTRVDPPVDWIISSPSLRTRETTERLAAELKYEGDIAWHPDVYAARPDTLLTVLSAIPPIAEHAVLVGHNPGLEGLVAGLCTGSPDRLNLRMSPASVAHVALDFVYWNQVRWGAGILQFLLRPKLLR